MTFKRDKRDLTQFLQDILEVIDDIEGFIKEMEFFKIIERDHNGTVSENKS